MKTAREHIEQARDLLAEGSAALALVELEAALAAAGEGDDAIGEDERSWATAERIRARGELARARLQEAGALLEAGDREGARSAAETARELADDPALLAAIEKLRQRVVASVERAEATEEELEEVEIARLMGLNEVGVVVSLLEAEGIPVRAVQEFPHSLLPLSVDGLGQTVLRVARRDAERAVALLKATPVDPSADED